jgi:hypothetical protein
MAIADETDFNTAGFIFETYTGDGLDANLSMSDYDLLDIQDDFASFDASGINRIGMTISRDIGGGSWHYAGSINGDAAVTQDVTYSAETNLPPSPRSRSAISTTTRSRSTHPTSARSPFMRRSTRRRWRCLRPDMQLSGNGHGRKKTETEGKTRQDVAK